MLLTKPVNIIMSDKIYYVKYITSIIHVLLSILREYFLFSLIKYSLSFMYAHYFDFLATM